MLRWFGGGLILCGGLLARRAILDARRRAQRTRRELAAALEAMEAEVRLLLTPMPALLRRSYGAEVNAFFERASRELSRGASLEDAWRASSALLSLPTDERETVSALGARLGGGEEGVCAALALAASQLRGRYNEEEERRPQTERLTAALCVSISLMLAILLL